MWPPGPNEEGRLLSGIAWVRCCRRTRTTMADPSGGERGTAVNVGKRREKTNARKKKQKTIAHIRETETAACACTRVCVCVYHGPLTGEITRFRCRGNLKTGKILINVIAPAVPSDDGRIMPAAREHAKRIIFYPLSFRTISGRGNNAWYPCACDQPVRSYRRITFVVRNRLRWRNSPENRRNLQNLYHTAAPSL